MKEFKILPETGGFHDQSVRFVQFAYMALGSESKVNRDALKKMKLKKR